ncbi:hypothetical protein J0S82_017747 [Galemys pyrenaicus]|uniref:Uncharacterized protein n=1 Tax=Galemys pyrenaicus TaxID=202257 RepID=A0A8J6DY80_GALPY|nr:hypothetical protein J0S82_017747 [Galemys pyrenaicus]
MMDTCGTAFQGGHAQVGAPELGHRLKWAASGDPTNRTNRTDSTDEQQQQPRGSAFCFEELLGFVCDGNSWVHPVWGSSATWCPSITLYPQTPGKLTKKTLALGGNLAWQSYKFTSSDENIQSQTNGEQISIELSGISFTYRLLFGRCVCPEGFSSPHTPTQACPPGTFSNCSDVFDPSQCETCPAGLTCARGTGDPEQPLAPCPPGHYCPPGTKQPTQFQCPPGTWSNQTGLTMDKECTPCPKGWFCTSGAQAPSGTCKAGHYCPQGECCRFCSGKVTGHSEQGGTCPVGHFCPQGTSLPQLCPAGTYSNLTGQASCFSCPAGYYCPEGTTSYSRHPCPAGFYCPRGECTKYATQFPCPRGYYNPDPLTQSLDSCLPCPAGHYCGQENLTQPSGPCDAGWFCVLAAWTARPFDLDNYTSTNCLCPATVTGGKCPAGSFCPEGSPEPLPCSPGSFCATSGYYCDSSMGPVQDFSLYPCPQGYYCPLGTAVATHHSCPVGTYGSRKGLRSIRECQLCPAGKFCALAGLTAPTGKDKPASWRAEMASGCKGLD